MEHKPRHTPERTGVFFPIPKKKKKTMDPFDPEDEHLRFLPPLDHCCGAMDSLEDQQIPLVRVDVVADVRPGPFPGALAADVRVTHVYVNSVAGRSLTLVDFHIPLSYVPGADQLVSCIDFRAGFTTCSVPVPKGVRDDPFGFLISTRVPEALLPLAPGAALVASFKYSSGLYPSEKHKDGKGARGRE
jgi:hypothetical protein